MRIRSTAIEQVIGRLFNLRFFNNLPEYDMGQGCTACVTDLAEELR